MAAVQTVSCACGQAEFTLAGEPIMVTECMCDSCRKAGNIMEALDGAPAVLDAKQATLTAMYRKDRVSCTQGADNLKEFRLTPDSKTRRVVATCCNSGMFLDFTKGHWVDIYGQRWPEQSRPVAEIRTMVGDLQDATSLPADIPNLKTHSFGFFAKLMGAWAAMGFRTAPIGYVNGRLDIGGKEAA